MTTRDHERFRRQLEKQLRADVELIYAAYCAKLRAYEMMHPLHGDLDDLEIGALPPAGLPLSLPPVPVPALPPPAPSAPSPRPPKQGPNELYNAVLQVLGQLPEIFNRSHVHAALGYEPRRASLYRVLRDLKAYGWLAVEEYGEGRLSNCYRRLATPDPADLEAADSSDEDPTSAPEGS
jgi:hypothetical protein